MSGQRRIPHVRGEVIIACRACLRRLEASVETNGDGHLVELVRPCPCTRSRLLPRPAPAMPLQFTPPPTRKRIVSPAQRVGSQYVCIIGECGQPLDWKGFGRPPLYCSKHQR